ncbi:hypothetical protein CFB84_25960 [Burkholderia aenigmatica]|uniref:Uncharacterized protein n=1 Tax=Burkholderia aenigmatica TaxID=2015348 RepID=A0A228IBH4_9BURK|nr:hypothetical protein CFB84_25960 [Burkholderia aenigmatica]
MPISKPSHYVESIEILTEPVRRRRRTAQEKIVIVQETLEPGASLREYSDSWRTHLGNLLFDNTVIDLGE